MLQRDITLYELVTRDQIERLSGGSLDLGLARPPIARTELASRKFRAEPLLAALPEGHPLAGGSQPLELAEFHGADLVMYSPTESRYFHELLVTTFGNADVQPTYVQYVSQIHTALALVQVGLGSALVRDRGPVAPRERDLPLAPSARTGSGGTAPGLAPRERQSSPARASRTALTDGSAQSFVFAPNGSGSRRRDRNEPLQERVPRLEAAEPGLDRDPRMTCAERQRISAAGRSSRSFRFACGT
ncbi:LysR substrate-binding domain-containing protein [Saccharopolyspora sp. NPDC000995]